MCGQILFSLFLAGIFRDLGKSVVFLQLPMLIKYSNTDLINVAEVLQIEVFMAVLPCYLVNNYLPS